MCIHYIIASFFSEIKSEEVVGESGRHLLEKHSPDKSTMAYNQVR